MKERAKGGLFKKARICVALTVVAGTTLLIAAGVYCSEKHRDVIGDRVFREAIIEAENDRAAFGDLNGDGMTDAALIVTTRGENGSTNVGLELVLNHEDTPYRAAYEPLEDAVKTSSVFVRSGMIVIDLTAIVPSDSPCCPRLVRRKVVYALVEGQLVQLSSVVLD